MAVEARRLSPFPPQILSSRGTTINSINGIENVYGTPIGYGVMAPLSGTTTATETLVPIYGSAMMEATPAKTAAFKSDSGLSYAVPVSRKRSRYATSPMVSLLPDVVIPDQCANNHRGSFTFFGEDFSFQFQQQKMEIDRFIAEYTENMRLEVEKSRKRFSGRIAAAVEESVLKKLKSKEDELQKMGILNSALEERVRSLCVENQLWRDLAQTNETTVNALRCNLEHILAQAQDERRHDSAALTDDAQSSCCSGNFIETHRRTSEESFSDDRDVNQRCIGPSNMTMMCRSCGKEESSVLVLPCRHLCLCTLCGSSLQKCPVCNSIQTASVHVNLSLA